MDLSDVNVLKGMHKKYVSILIIFYDSFMSDVMSEDGRVFLRVAPLQESKIQRCLF